MSGFAPEGALCAETDPEAFYPETGDHGHAALEICRRCPVRDACLTYALENDERFGIWGGTTALQRRRLKVRVRAL